MSSLVERWQHSMMNNYGGPAIGLVEGSGAVLTDENGKQYVDMLGGIAVNALGHAHPAVVQAVTQQISTLGHVSNYYVAEPTVALAELLLALAGRPGKVIFTNSGAEANEAAFKLSRLTGRTHVVSTEGGFHGRTMGALALTGQPKKQDPFRPLPGDVTFVAYGDSAALKAAVTPETAMVILEPIQGENGIIVPPPGYLAAAREICTATGALLVLDEIQTGIGRTGNWFHHQSEGVDPDIVTLAKGLGGGLPLGAALAFGKAADLFTPGSHGSTFAGNPISCAAGLAVIRTIAGEGLLDHVKRIGELIRRGIEGFQHPLVSGVRGAGLLLGVQLTEAVSADLAAKLRDAGFLVNPIQPDVIRLAPPLILSSEQAEAFLTAFQEALP
jgi:acetylornithine/N-succinyldiaminopimelate aminotransferase